MSLTFWMFSEHAFLVQLCHNLEGFFQESKSFYRGVLDLYTHISFQIFQSCICVFPSIVYSGNMVHQWKWFRVSFKDTYCSYLHTFTFVTKKWMLYRNQACFLCSLLTVKGLPLNPPSVTESRSSANNEFVTKCFTLWATSDSLNCPRDKSSQLEEPCIFGCKLTLVLELWALLSSRQPPLLEHCLPLSLAVQLSGKAHEDSNSPTVQHFRNPMDFP